VRDIDLRPLGPFVDLRARHAIRRPEWSGAIAAGQIAKDRSRFPQRLVAIITDNRHGTVGIHRQESGRVGAAIAMAGVVALIGETKLADAPHERLDVGGGLASPHGQHRHRPFTRRATKVAAFGSIPSGPSYAAPMRGLHISRREDSINYVLWYPDKTHVRIAFLQDL
jgi:hypothetical protein